MYREIEEIEGEEADRRSDGASPIETSQEMGLACPIEERRPQYFLAEKKQYLGRTDHAGPVHPCPSYPAGCRQRPFKNKMLERFGIRNDPCFTE
jgi:hypothetical protein